MIKNQQIHAVRLAYYTLDSCVHVTVELDGNKNRNQARSSSTGQPNIEKKEEEKRNESRCSSIYAFSIPEP